MSSSSVDMRVRAAAKHPSSDSPRISAVLDSIRDAIVVADQQGRVLCGNAAAENIFQYRRDEIIGSHAIVLVPEPIRSQYSKSFGSSLRAVHSQGAAA